MRRTPLALSILFITALVVAPAPGQPDAKQDQSAGFVHFRPPESDRPLKVGYAVLLADVNGDGKPDIVVVDTDRVVWYENPSWKRRTIIEGQTKPDNVCIAAYDIDGDGHL